MLSGWLKINKRTWTIPSSASSSIRTWSRTGTRIVRRARTSSCGNPLPTGLTATAPGCPWSPRAIHLDWWNCCQGHFKIIREPGQFLPTHLRVFVLDPGQKAGLEEEEQERVLVPIPSPQAWLQLLQGDHGDQEPSNKLRQKDDILWNHIGWEFKQGPPDWHRPSIQTQSPLHQFSPFPFSRHNLSRNPKLQIAINII